MWPKKLHKIIILLLVSGLLAALLASLSLGQEPSELPRDWNANNLAEIAPPASKVWTFAVLGDTKNGRATFGRLLRQMSREPGLAFALYMGDMVEEGTEPNYRLFFREITTNLTMPLLGVIGNHELKGEGLNLYRKIWAPVYYSFRVKDTYFIVLDDAAPENLNPSQWQWLEGELLKAQSCQIRLVFMHIPLFDPRDGGFNHCLPPEPAKRLLDLFKKYRITRVFAAHVHGYFTGNWSGLPYTITGGAGAPLYGADLDHFFYHYLTVAVMGDVLQIQVHRLGEREGAATPLAPGYARGGQHLPGAGFAGQVATFNY